MNMYPQMETPQTEIRVGMLQILQHIWTTKDMLVTLTFIWECLTTLRAIFVFHTSLLFILSYASLTDFHCRHNVFNPLPASGKIVIFC